MGNRDRRPETIPVDGQSRRGEKKKMNLKKLFIEADAKFNSGLFHREDWLEKLEIDDKTLSPIIKQLYYPDCPYEFSVLPVEIQKN